VFIVLDGLDASGKSTQALRLRDHLLCRGLSVHLRFHPSDDNPFGVRARRFLLARGKSAHFASAIFYIVDVIRSILLCPWWSVDCILFVRYLMGTAYLPQPLDRFAYQLFASILPRPTCKFFLDVEPEEANRRISENRKDREMFESLEQLRKVNEKALSLARVYRWTIVDANRPEDEVAKYILTHVSLPGLNSP